MSDTTSPGCAGLTPPLPPFSPVQVTSSLPPLGTAPMDRSVSLTTVDASSLTKITLPPSTNHTGLSRAEIRLLAEAVSEAEVWRGTLTEEADRHEFDARITKMKAAIRKLKAASGYNFSGRKKK